MKGLARKGKVHYVVSLLVIVCVLLSFGLVLASSEGAPGGDDHGAGKGLDLLWRTINFGVLAAILIYFVRKPIAQGLAGRRQGIRDQLDDLERQKREAEEQLAENKNKLALLDKEVEKIIAEYIQQGETVKERIIEDAKAAAEKLQEQAKKNIEHEFEKARQELRVEMAEQAVAMAEELIKKNIKKKDQERIIDEYLTKVVVAQ